MKKLLSTFLFLGVYLNSYSQTNVYHEFPTSDAIWREYSYQYQFQSSDHSCSDYQNVIDGDTLAGSFTYHKIRSSCKYYASPYCGYPPSMYTPSYFNYYLGAFREDTANRKVYFIPSDSISESLLYDFNLNLGDTLPITYTNNDHNDINSPTTNIVTSVDSVLIGNEYRKRFEISAYNWGGSFAPYVYLIEGIGSTFGLLGWLRPDPEVPMGSTLLCFKQNGLTVFPDSNYQCDIVSSINENEIKSEPVIQIFPNPFNFTTEISFDKTYKTIDLTIFDLQGKITKNETCNNSNKINLDRLELENGFYFLRITLDKKVIETEKIIILD